MAMNDYDRNGEVQRDRYGNVVSTAPGAPLARGSSSGLTDPLLWANQFRSSNDRLLSNTPGAVPGAATPMPKDGSGSISSAILSEILPLVGSGPISLNTPGVFSGQKPANSPISLNSLAPAAQSHADRWRVGDRGVMTIGADRSRSIFSPFGSGRTTFGPSFEPQREDLSGSNLKWGSAFR